MSTLAPEVTIAQALAEMKAAAYARGRAEAEASFFGANATFLMLNIFAEALSGAARFLTPHDAAGAALLQDFSSRMKAAGSPPSVTSRTPADGSVGVAVGEAISAQFSLDMDPASFTDAVLFVTPAGGGSHLAGEISYDAPSRTVSFVPAHDLSPGTEYKATIAAAATSATEVPLGQDVTWTFTTA